MASVCPRKDDEFTITTQVQSRGQWILHPLDETLRLAADKTYGSIKEGSQPSLSDGGEGGSSTADLEQATLPIPTVRPIRSGKRSLKEKIESLRMQIQVRRWSLHLPHHCQHLRYLHDASCAVFRCECCSMTPI